jgi:glycosyltransferase involved in cell wall biosynthesis
MGEENMKILIYGDYYKWKSGFAREIKDILPFLKEKNELRLVALGYNGYPRDNDYIVYHTKTPEVKDYYAQEVLHYALDDFKPDMVLTVGDFYMLPKISFVMAHPGNFRWVHWGTLDSAPLDFYSRESLNWLHYAFFQSHHAAIECKIKNPALMGEVVYPSVDEKIFYKTEDKQALKKQYKLDSFNVLICNARGQQRKNVPVLIDAFKQVLQEIPETTLILASGMTQTKTDDNHLDGYDLDRFVSEQGLTDYILLPRSIENKGPIDDETLNLQYNLADINILPSWGEGFGLPFIEAGICEVPSIGVDNSAVHEILKSRGVLVQPRALVYNNDGSAYSLCNSTDLKDAIVDLIKDTKKREELGKKMCEFSKLLTPESRAKQMLVAFEKLIASNALPASRR